jgi:hypothetical protein
LKQNIFGQKHHKEIQKINLRIFSRDFFFLNIELYI